MIRPSHRAVAQRQQVWIIFGGEADMAWQRLLRPGFRHCFAALRDDAGWLVMDPLSGCLVLGRVDVPADFDLPAFYRRAGLAPLGPFPAGRARPSLLPGMLPMNCVGLCRALLGAVAPFALTPVGLYRALAAQPNKRKKSLTSGDRLGYQNPINGRIAPGSIPAGESLLPFNRYPSRPGPLTRVLAFFSSPMPRRETPMGSLFKAPKPVRIDPPVPPPQPTLPAVADVVQATASATRNRALRGIQGTIVTSPRGVLEPLPVGLPRKSLLGE